MKPTSLDVCRSCGGFLPRAANACPNCRTAVASSLSLARLKMLGGAFGGGAIAFTLMACYGAPVVCDEPGGCGYDGGQESGDARDAARDTSAPDVIVGHDASDASDASDAADASDASDDAPDGD